MRQLISIIQSDCPEFLVTVKLLLGPIKVSKGSLLRLPGYKETDYRGTILYNWGSIPNFIIWGWDLMTANLDIHDSLTHSFWV